MANEFVTRTGLIVSGSTFLPAVTTASKGYILSFDDTTKQVYYMSTSSVTVTVPGSDTQIIYNNGGAFGAASNFVFSGSNVGIGTSSPLTLLDLRASSNSTITPLASVPDTATTLLIGNTGTNGVLALGHDNDGHPWLQGRSVLANQAPTVILLNPLGGNVGIGTTSPTTTLYVKATGSLIETGSLTVDTTAVSNTQVFMDLKGTAGGDQYLLRHYRSTTLQNYILDDQGRLNFYTKPLTAYTGSTAFGFFADSTVTGNIVSFGSISGNTQMVISASGNVGIGTTTPSQKLDVQGDISVGVSGATTVHTYYNSTTRNQIVYTNNSSFEFHEGASERVRIAAGGSVGIGTSSPGAKLNVRGGNILIDNTTLLQWGYGDGTTYIYGDASNPTGSLKLGTANADRLTVTYAGNVGIGTTSPSSLLHVSGTTPTVTIEGSSTNSAKINLVGSFTTWALENQYVNGATNDMFRIYNSQLGANAITINRLSNNVGIGTTSPNATLDVNGNVLVTGSLTVSGSSTFTNIGPAVFTGSITQNASTASFGGVVGIGTTTPSTTLDVNGRAIVGGGLSGNALSISTSVGTYTFNGYDLLTPSSFIITAGSSGYLTLDGYPVIFKVSGGEKMRVNTDGNVGIGTTSPSAKLDVRTDTGILIRGASGTTDGRVAIIPATGGRQYGLRNYGSSFGIIDESADVVRMFFHNNGNTGIANGTNLPTATLEVNGNVKATSFTGSFSGSVSAPGSTTQIVYNSGGALAADSGLVYSGSAVGIGTATPSSGTKLQVDGNIYSNNVGGNSFTLNSFGANYGFISTTANNTFSLGYGPSLGTLGTPVLTWNSSGNVGIGTTTPSTALTVAGAISSSGATFVGGNLSVGTTYNSFAANIAGTTYVIGASVWVNDGYGYANASSGNTGFFPSGSSDIRINSAGTTRMFIASGSGNVGIGTTSPLNLLHVSQASANTIFRLGNNASYDQFIYFNGGNDWSLGMDYSNSNAFVLSNASSIGTNDRLVVTTGGNVGIGTTAPGAKLDIVSTGAGTEGLRVDGTGGGFAFVVKAGSDYTSHIRAGATVGVNYFTTPPSNGLIVEGNVGIGTTSPISGQGTPLTLASSTGYVGLTLSGSGAYSHLWQLYASGDGGSNKFFGIYDSTNAVYRLVTTSTGNVGIGTTSPAGKLTVKSPGEVSSYGDGFVLERNANSAKLVRIYESGADGYLEVRTGNDSIISKLSGYSGTPSYFLSRVGIGTTSPSASLNIASDGNTQFTITRTNASNSQQFNINVESDSQTSISYDSNSPLVIGTSTNPGTQAGFTERMRITSGGNVGIGVSNPTYNLHVSSSGYYGGNLTVEGTITAQKLNVQQVTSSVIYSSGSNVFGNSLANTQTFTGSLQVTGSTHYLLGNVGIGITSPNSYNGYSTLTLNGSTGGVVDFESGGSRIATINNPGSGLDIYTMVAAPIVFGTDITARMTITSGGKIGIGTSTPTSLLYVYNDTAWSAANLNELTGSAMAFKVRSRNSINSEIVMGAMGDDNTGLQAINNSTAAALKFVINPFGGNVGIGTTSPTHLLSLNRVTEAAAYQLNINSAGGISDGNFTGIRFSQDSDASTELGNIKLHYYSNGATDLSFGTRYSPTAVYIQSGGNVGIGTTSPATKLQVAGTTTITGGDGLYINSSAGDIGNIFTSPSTHGLYIDYPTAYFFAIRGTSEYLRITSAGNVGIGTTSPAYTLDVAGGSGFRDTLRILSSGTDTVQLSWTSTNNGVINVFNGGSVTTQILGNGNSYFNGGNVGIGTTSPTGRLTVAPYNTVNSSSIEFTDADNAVISSYYSQTFAVDNTNTQSGRQFVFSKGGKGYGTQTKTMMVIDADSGNVGIGTTSPTALLHLSSTSPLLRFTNTSNGAGAGSIQFYSGSTQMWNLGTHTDNDLYLYNNTTGTYNLWIDNANGNTGVGVVNPNSKLVVARDVTDNDLSQYGYVQLKLIGSSTNAKQLLLGFETENNYGFIQTLQDGASWTTYNLALQWKGGNVGIGTKAPVVKTHIVGPTLSTTSETTYPLWLSDTGDTTKALILGFDLANDVGVIQAVDQAVAWKNVAISPSGGNVGIGTTSPAYKLQVSGAGNAGGVLAGFTGTGPSGSISIGHSGNGGSIGYANIGAGAASNVFYVTTGAGTIGSGFAMDNNGNVGIGTTSPSSKIHAVGSSTTELRLQNSDANNNYGFVKYDTQNSSGGNLNIGTNASGGGYGAMIFTADNNIDFLGGGDLRIVKSGNVGIGTYSPLNKLFVTATVTDYVAVIENLGTGTDKNGLWIKTDSSWTNSTVLRVTGDTSDTDIFRVNTANVRIGKGTFSVNDTALHVSGAITIEAQSTQTQFATTFAGSVSSNTNIASVPTGSFKAAFFDYYVASGSVNMRAGTVMAVHNNSTSRYTDTSTADIGNTAAVDFSTSVVGGNLVLTANISSGTWEIKTAYRAL